MTPSNIVNMAKIKGLDIIAVADHNSCENIKAIAKNGLEANILVVFGMEIQSAEEVHLLTLFQNSNDALNMSKIVKESLLNQKNVPEIFGNQLVLNSNDETIYENEDFLIGATTLTIEEVFEKVKQNNGIVIPAHIDRDSYSILSNLGMIPEGLNINYVEYSKKCDIKKFISERKYLEKYPYIQSSDAHYLGDIFEAEDAFEIELEDLSIKSLFKKLAAN